MSTRLRSTIALVLVLVVIVSLGLVVVGCGKRLSSEDQKMLDDPDAMHAKQKQMQQEARQRNQAGNKMGPGYRPGG